MSQPFVVSLKIAGDGKGAAQAAREVRTELEALQRTTTQLATGRSAAGIDEMLGIGASRGNTAQAQADVEAYGRELDNLRAKFVPLASLERQHEANLAGIAGAYRVGAITADEQTAAIDREKAAHLRAVAALDGHTHAINVNAAANGRAMAQRTNLLFQLQDIAVTLAMGMNPAMVAMQQGSQISMIYGPEEGGLGKALSETGKMATGLVTKLWPVALAVGAVSIAIGGMRHEIEEASGVAVSFGDVTAAVFQVTGDRIYKWLKPAIDAIAPWFQAAWDWSVGATKDATNFMIQSVLVFVEQVRLVHDVIPALFSVAGQMAAKGFISSIEWLVQKTLEGVDTLIAGVNSFIDMFGGDALRDALGWDLAIPQLADASKPFTLGVKFDTSGAESEIAAIQRRYQEAFAEIRSTDYAGDFFSDVQTQAIANYNAGLEDTEKKAKRAATGLKGMSAEAKRLQEQIDFARSTFTSVFTDMRQNIAQGQGFWEALGNAGASALDKIADRALSMAAGGIFDMIFGAVLGMGNSTGGFLNNMLGGGPVRLGFNLPGYAVGTSNHPGGPAVINERGGEIVDLPSGSRVYPRDISLAMAAESNAPGVTLAPVYNFNGSNLTEAQVRRLMQDNNRDLVASLPGALADANRRAVKAA